MSLLYGTPQGHTARRTAAKKARARGVRNEELVVTVLSARSPWWLVDVRRATPSEDRSGVDVVVQTADLGVVYIQVKSSSQQARIWRHRYRHDRRPIGLVVVPKDQDERVIYGRAIGALILLRERLSAAASAALAVLHAKMTDTSNPDIIGHALTIASGAQALGLSGDISPPRGVP